MDEEGMSKTENDLIYIGHPIRMNDDIFLKELKELDEACHNESLYIEDIVKRVVSTYDPDYTKRIMAVQNSNV